MSEKHPGAMTPEEIDAYVLEVYEKVAWCIETIVEDDKAAEVVRRAAALFVKERDISFQQALAALLGQATTHRERADVTRAGAILRTLAKGMDTRT